jgi:hypothetical protein
LVDSLLVVHAGVIHLNQSKWRWFEIIFDDYNKIKKKLQSIYYLGSPMEEISIHLQLMYKALEDELGTLCRQEILEKIVNDVGELGISEEQVYRLLKMEVVY